MLTHPFEHQSKPFPVSKDGRPRISGTSWSSSISNTTKSAGKINLSTFTNASSMIPRGYLMDQFASCKEMVVCFISPSPNFLQTESGIRLMLAPRSHKTLSKNEFPIVQGKVKLPESFNF